MFLLRTVHITIFILVKFSLSEIPVMTKYYCVIGAGPSGLQMAYFLRKDQRDYIVFEKSDTAGSFFQHYPRHRRLISTNNRTTGSSNKEYNLRYDLNSLISDDDNLIFTKYSEKYLPMADELMEYLKDYRKKLKLNVQFNTTISGIRYRPDAKTDQCRYTMTDQNDNLYCCRNVFIGTGWQKEKIPVSLQGQEYVQTYQSMSVDPNDYKDQTILIIGRGSSGIETALALEGTARTVHMASANNIALNWEAQYLGAVGALKQEMFDGLEGFFVLNVEKVGFRKRANGKIQVISEDDLPQQLLLEGYDRIVLCLGFQWDSTIFHQDTPVGSYDYPNVQGDTYPNLGNDYQSIQYPGVYFIGPLVHALDYRKSAGGFIHGFRNCERALHRLMEWRNHGVRWPSVVKTVDQIVPTVLKRAEESSGLPHMFSHLADLAIYDRTINKFTYLEEFPISLIPQILKYTGYEFNPIKHSIFILLFQYGDHFFKPSESLDTVKFENEKLLKMLHPVIYYYEKKLPTAEEMEKREENEVLPNPTAVHHISDESEDPTMHIHSLRRFVQNIVNLDLRSFSQDTCLAYTLTRKRDENDKLQTVCRNVDAKYDSALLFH